MLRYRPELQAEETMRPNDFRTLVLASSFEATRFAQRFVFDVLPFSFRYKAYLNESCDEHVDSESVVYPGDDGKVVSLDSEQAVVDLLLREGRCPEWIDIAVQAVVSVKFSKSGWMVW